MKPEKLIISAFGPYAAETEVDFTKLGDGEIPVQARRRSLTLSPLRSSERPAGPSGRPVCSRVSMQRPGHRLLWS